jgi:FMN phosphatase YigB (HAD superfamily)
MHNLLNIPTILFDIDGTLANIEHRTHFVSGKKKDFDAFNEAMVDDVPNEPIVTLLNSLEHKFQIVYVTGRLERYREVTEKFLEGVKQWWTHDLYLLMRPDDQRYIPDYEVKQKLLDEILAEIDKDNIVFAVDDRSRVVKMWRDNDITTLQVADGNY